MPTGFTQDAGWQIGVSKTLAHPPSAVWEFISSEEGLALWIGPGVRLTPEKGSRYTTEEGDGEVRSYRPGDRIRLTYRPKGDDHHTTRQIAVTATPDGRAMLRFHEERLRSAEERERRREHWQRVMTRVAAALG
ncbi:SRPBCC domain-containing protein [Streptomyces sp. JJ38]|uniref:SRPBCC family protein n=1 Tax=Streptomyces sp. JJ38 TaxID=2738128 RepID=UPI001C55D7F9|nr:SRPBCC domain-containing protein [Streptomyces sp. JJ38]MBW1600045.1 SRPBCC domain-containing protein [Streptomyces sp. JJ38]